MGRRILAYVIFWVAVLVILCIIALVKYRDILFQGLGSVFSQIFFILIIIAGIIFMIMSAVRRR